jgi:tetrahydromethanopterin S-methyltransferase subunit G
MDDLLLAILIGVVGGLCIGLFMCTVFMVLTAS